MICKSCGALIYWARTDKGKAMPLDAEMTADGQWLIHAGRLVRKQNAASPAHRSHFETCPHASEHRHKDKTHRDE